MSTLETNLIQPSTGTTLTLGASGDTVTLGSGATNNLGITMADQWRLTAVTNSGTDADVTSNWERNDNTSYGSIGTGMTNSSGIFTFPQTGIYFIYFVSRAVNAASDTSAIFQLFTTVDNSNYIESAVANTGNASGSTTTVQCASNSYIFDVTNTTTHKFKFATASFSSGTFLTGDTSFQRTGFTVLRLGDT